MAAEDDGWTVVTPTQRREEAPPAKAAPAPQQDDASGWATIAPSKPQAGTSQPMIEASPQYTEDVKLVGEPSVKGGLEIFGKRAADTAFFGLPSHALTWAKRGLEEVTPEEREAMGTVSQRFQKQARTLPPAAERKFQETVKNIPSIAEDYYRDYYAEKARQEALQRQHPYYAGAGTATGFLGGMAMPLGPLAKPGQIVGGLVERGAGKLLSEGAANVLGRGAESAFTGALLSGGSSMIEEPDINRALYSAGIGAVAGPVLSAAANKLVGHFAANPEPLTPSGNWKPEAQKVIDEVFGPSIMAGKLDPADLDLFKTNLAQIFRDKGINAPAAREAGLQAAGAERPIASQTTGRAPTSGVMAEPEVVEAAQEAGKGILGKLASEVPIIPTPPNMAAQELYQAAKSAKEAVGKSYEALGAEPGRFTLGSHGKTISTNMPTAIDAELSKSGYPIGERLGTVPQYSTAKEAYKMVQDTIGSGNMPLGEELTMANINEVRKGINKLWQSAPSGSADRNAIDAIRRGFDNALIESAQAGLFTGNAGQAIALLKQSTDLHGKFRQMFESGATGEDKIIRAAVNAFRDQRGKLNPQSVDSAAQVAQGILNSSLVNKTLGPAVYNKLETTLGKGTPAMEAVRNNLRASIFNTGGDIKNLAKNIDDIISPQNKLLAKKLFDPPEMARLRLTAQALNDVLRNPKADRSLNDELSDVLIRNIPKTLVRSFYAAAGALHSGPAGAVVGGLLGATQHAGEKLGENWSRARQIKRELSGAPTVRPEYDRFTAPKTDLPLVPMFPSDTDSAYGPPQPFVVGRATGGRVTTPESIADRLVSMADRAKKEINNNTQALLQTPDDHVAKALEIANRQIEG